MSEDFSHFVTAQDHIYPQALQEIKSGKKRSHWMWFIFPQIRGLGYSDVSRKYAVQSIGEARAYLEHPLLGKRLREISGALLELSENDATQIFGRPDDMKLKSCMTLFSMADHKDQIFRLVLDKFFNGEADAATQNVLNSS